VTRMTGTRMTGTRMTATKNTTTLPLQATGDLAATAAFATLPALVTGHVAHHRTGQVRRSFRHGVYQWLVDLDAIPAQPWFLRPFASFSAADHLGDPTRSIRANVGDYLRGEGIELGESGRVVMLANARVLGHVFDPLSVFWCFDAQDCLVAILAEVHNTYGQRHTYLLRPTGSGVATADKVLAVSPFFDVSGRYELRFELTPSAVSSTVVLHRHGQAAFTATFHGHRVPATRKAIVTALIRRPLMPQQVSALIRMHGIWLWLRRLPVVSRPDRQKSQQRKGLT
jgi:uncharacterized protein